jgi:predicted NBD/HSP70 family sugar kinase
MTTTKPILACDVGGTRIKLGLVRGARLLAQSEIDAEPKNGLAFALRRIAHAVPPLCRKAGVEQPSLGGFGLSFPGIIEPRTEKILSPPAGKYDDAKNLDVPKLVRRELRLPTRLRPGSGRDRRRYHAQRKIILPVLRRHVAERAWTPWGNVKIKPAALGNAAGMCGGASLFQEEK